MLDDSYCSNFHFKSLSFFLPHYFSLIKSFYELKLIFTAHWNSEGEGRKTGKTAELSLVFPHLFFTIPTNHFSCFISFCFVKTSKGRRGNAFNFLFTNIHKIQGLGDLKSTSADKNLSTSSRNHVDFTLRNVLAYMPNQRDSAIGGYHGWSEWCRWLIKMTFVLLTGRKQEQKLLVQTLLANLKLMYAQAVNMHI